MKNTIKNLAMLIALATAEVLLLVVMAALLPVEYLTERTVMLWQVLNRKHQQLLEQTV